MSRLFARVIGTVGDCLATLFRSVEPFKICLSSLFPARRRPIRKAGRRPTPWNRGNLHLEKLEDRLTPASIVTLVSFGSPGTDGASYPFTGLVADSSGNLFGTTQGGGAAGTVFELVHNTKTITDHFAS